jgi:hypothetical protein
MSAPARNAREVRRRPRRAAALERARIRRDRGRALAEEIRAQFIAAGREPAPRWGGRTGRELFRYLSETGGWCREAYRAALRELSLVMVRTDREHSAAARQAGERPIRRHDSHAPPRCSVLDHLIAAPRTGPPAAAAAVGFVLPDCTGGAVVVS